MNYPELQEAVKRTGFNVVEFEDCREYFGCWSLTVEGHGHTCLIVHEGRDGWLMFYRAGVDGTFTELEKKQSAWMDNADKAACCLGWLSSCNPTRQERKVRSYYMIAEKDLVPHQPHSSEWPKSIGYCYSDDYFLLYEGKGHGLGGCAVAASEAREPKWRYMFTALEVEWFMDFLETSRFTSEEAFVLALEKKVGRLGIQQH